MLVWLFSIILLFVVYHQYKKISANPRGLPFPPGPKPLPILGNVLDMKKIYDRHAIKDWAKQYGDIMHVQLFGIHIVYLNTLEVANDLFEKRSATYSDRPRLVMANEVIGWEWAIAFMPYGPRWRKMRKSFHQFFQPSVSQSYQPSQTRESRKLLARFLKTPENVFPNVRHSVAATIMRVTYGLEVKDTTDSYIIAAEKAMSNLGSVFSSGTWMVDIIPLLKYLPEWFPGTKFKRIGKEWGAQMRTFKTLPFEATKEAVEQGESPYCALAEMLKDLNNGSSTDAPVAEEEELIKDVAATAYVGGIDTTVSALQAFFLAIGMHPEVQAKAQAQLDFVIGQDRLPEFDDMSSLPYIEAILLESLRSHPVAPLGVAHRLQCDDEYKGYFLPKGTFVIGNVWNMMRDENVYRDASSFKPERFLDSDGQLDASVRNPGTSCFGFGRRVCPGEYMGYNTMFITIASVLATFTVEPVLDEGGKPEANHVGWMAGMLSYPNPYKCRVRPRNSKAITLIEKSQSP